MAGADTNIHKYIRNFLVLVRSYPRCVGYRNISHFIFNHGSEYSIAIFFNQPLEVHTRVVAFRRDF